MQVIEKRFRQGAVVKVFKHECGSCVLDRFMIVKFGNEIRITRIDGQTLKPICVTTSLTNQFPDSV